MRRAGFVDLLAVAIAAVACMISAVSPTLDQLVRLSFAVALVVVLPGYAMTAVLFARRPIGGLACHGGAAEQNPGQ